MITSRPACRAAVLALAGTWLLAALTFVAALRGAPGPAERRARFDIPAGDVVTSFRQFSAQSGAQLLYAVDMVEGVQTNAVKGEYSVREAIDRLLAGTTLTAQLTNSGAITVRKTDAQDPKVPSATPGPARRAADSDLGQRGDASVVELSPFVVNTSRDVGYLAENTLAGSRLNTRLRDTPTSVSVFTPEFIEDLGITDLGELMDYTVNSEVDVSIQRSDFNQNEIINALSLNRAILTRGLDAGQGLDFFNSITPVDPYRIGRYEDSRGPNSILFGIGSPGGLLNQSSKTAVAHRDSASIRYGFGSWGRSRLEFDANKVLSKKVLAASMAALHQENGGWRNFDFKDAKRIFGAITYTPIPQLTIQAMGETGREIGAVVTSYTQTEEVLAWYDNRQALGVNAVTFSPTNALPTPVQLALGVTARNAAAGGLNRRLVYIENNGTIFDAAGTLLTGTYNNAAVRAPDGTSGTTGSALRLNDPGFYPYFNNAAGPGMFRNQSLKNYTLTADWQLTRNLFLNIGHNNQETTAVVYLMTGTAPTLRGDANRTLGVNGPSNPYAGQLYFDGEWQRQFHEGNFKESRISLSYTLNAHPKWLGRHRIAGLAASSEEYNHLYVSWLVLAGRPFNTDPINPNNRVTVRNYITEGSYGTYRVGDWRSAPPKVQIGGKDYETTFANASAVSSNYAAVQYTDSALGVLQSHFLGDRLVSTFGYREDRAKIASFGYGEDPVRGAIVDPDPAKRTSSYFKGRTHTAGVVYHLCDWLSFLANRSSSIGVPSVQLYVFPHGGMPAPPKGEGRDYGLSFDLLRDRLNAKIVYFVSNERGRTEGQNAVAQFTNRNIRIMDAFGSVLVGAGRPYSQTEWSALYRQYTPSIGGATSDMDSEGYEARITANLTANWRLVANYSYTDSGRKNLYAEALLWYGFKTGGDGLVIQGVTQNASGQFVVNRNAFENGGTIAKWIDLGVLNPSGNLASLTTSANVTVAQEILNLVDFINQAKQSEEKRWGLRPHKISLFTTFDLKKGWLDGFSLGGGWRWRSANVIGTNSNGSEITGRVITSTDLMLRYARRIKGLPGRVSFQMNVYNLFDRTGMIPQRLSTSSSSPNGFQLPGGRGVAYSRFDLIAPRDVRFTTSYSF